MQSRTVSWLPYLTLIIIFLIIWLGLDFNGLYGQDSHEYLRYSKAIKLFVKTGVDPGNFYWPKLYPFLGAIISYSGLSVNLSLQLVSLGSILGAFYFAQKSFRLLYKTDGSWFLVLGAATQVYFIRSGIIVMSDALTTFSLMGFLFYYLRFVDQKATKDFLLLTFFGLIAVFSRYAAMPLITIPVLHAIYLLVLKVPLLYRILIITTGLLTSFIALFLNNQALDLIGKMFETWSVLHLFQRNFMFDSFPQTYWVPNGIYMLSNFAHLGFLSMGVLLLFWWKKWNFKLPFLWMGIIAYLIFIGGIGFQNQRFMVITHLWILVLIFPAFEALKLWLGQRKLWWFFISGVVIFNGAFFYYSFSKTFAMHRLEKEIAQEVLKLDDAKTIYAFYITPSLGSYDIPNPKIDLWTEEIEFKEGNFAVFNEKQFGQNQRVMKNWQRLNDEFEVNSIKNLPKGWKIYRIESLKIEESSSN